MGRRNPPGSQDGGTCCFHIIGWRNPPGSQDGGTCCFHLMGRRNPPGSQDGGTCCFHLIGRRNPPGSQDGGTCCFHLMGRRNPPGSQDGGTYCFHLHGTTLSFHALKIAIVALTRWGARTICKSLPCDTVCGAYRCFGAGDEAVEGVGGVAASGPRQPQVLLSG
jgi:hypothetical protein